jgi:soluble lytic murein transglycosylase-like protein
VLHRDLKPGNIVMGEFGETVVLDWGLAKKLEDGAADPSQPALQSLLDTNSGKTHEGAVLGTPAYMSPEQAVGAANLDERSDVWSLGAILYALLTGRRVFEGETSEQVLLQVATAPVLPARDLSPGAPPELCAVAARALSRNPAERYRDAAALSEDLEAWLAGRAVGVYQYSSWELLRRFVARNRALSIVSAALAAFVFAAAGDSIRGFREGFAERGREQAARARISELEPIIESEIDPARLSLLTEELENQVRVLGTLRRLHDSPSDVERAIHAVLASFNADTPAIPPSFVRAVERSIDEIVSDPETPATYARKKQIWPLIKAEFGAQGLPEAMAYIAWTESRFDPEARTPVGSLGIWQFVPGTARQAGLRVDEAVDERRDAARSTRAAARYLGALIGELGGAESFLLVLQSYNVGESKVRKILHEAALEPGGWRRERRDYFHLYRQKRFPRGEAANYVPKVFAAFLVASDPRKYGLEK